MSNQWCPTSNYLKSEPLFKSVTCTITCLRFMIVTLISTRESSHGMTQWTNIHVDVKSIDNSASSLWVAYFKCHAARPSLSAAFPQFNHLHDLLQLIYNIIIKIMLNAFFNSICECCRNYRFSIELIWSRHICALSNVPNTPCAICESGIFDCFPV